MKKKLMIKELEAARAHIDKVERALRDALSSQTKANARWATRKKLGIPGPGPGRPRKAPEKT